MGTSLSDLPDDLIDRIFSYVLWSPTSLWVSNIKVVKVSLLSKQLHRVLQKRSTLTFSTPIYKKKYRQELNYVRFTLDRYRRENISLETFALTDYGWSEVCNKCIELATKTGVRNLNLNMINLDKDYAVPQPVFQAESLVELNLRRCCLKPESLVMWPNLKRLCIVYGSCVAEEVFENIIWGCPSIEYLNLDRCFTNGFTFRVFNLRKLKKLNLRLCKNQHLELNATPNLESLICSCAYEDDNYFIDFGSTEYPSLRSLMATHGEIDLSSIARRFPVIEHLHLYDCSYKLKTIDLSSSSLKEIKLINAEALEKAFFHAPNLVHFEYENHCEIIPKLTFAGNSGRWSSCIKLRECRNNVNAASWFLELNEFVAALRRSETSIAVEYVGREVLSDEAHPIIANSSKGIREFKIDAEWLEISSASVSIILDGIFSICQPQTLTFLFCQSTKIAIPKNVLKLLHEKLVSESSRHRCSLNGFEASLIHYGVFKDWDKFLEVIEKEETQVLMQYISYHLEYIAVQG